MHSDLKRQGESVNRVKIKNSSNYIFMNRKSRDPWFCVQGGPGSAVAITRVGEVPYSGQYLLLWHTTKYITWEMWHFVWWVTYIKGQNMIMTNMSNV